MKKKIFTFLLALAASVGASWATVYNSGMVALSNLNVGDILMEGVTLTSEKADYEITLAANRVKCFSSIQSTDWNVLFSSINPVLGENAVILTSYPAIFYTPIDETGNIGNAWEVTENEVGTEVTIAGITYGSSVPEEPANPTVKVKGSWDDWAAAVELTDNGDGTASAVVAINGGEGYYTFKFVTNEGEASEAWLSDNAAYKRNYTGKENLTETETDAMTLWVDAKGTYTFTWTYATNAFNITFPALPTITVTGTGDFYDQGYDVVLLPAADELTATASYTFDESDKGKWYNFNVVVGSEWRSNAGEFSRSNTSASWINGTEENSMYFEIDEAGTYTFTWTYVENKLEITFPTPATPAAEEITAKVDPDNAGVYYATFFDSANKYALPAGVEAYVADLSGSNLVLTKIAAGGQTIPADNAVILKSTMANVTLTPSDAEAVTFTANNSLKGVDDETALDDLSLTRATCYVLSGTNEYGVGFYQINSDNLMAHKAYVPYSSPNPAPRRMPFIFDQATGMDNVQGDNVQSTKVVRDGQLVIIRNGVEYNAAGQIVK